MSVRARLSLLADKVKFVGGLDLALRYNPAAYASTQASVARFRAADPAARRAMSSNLTGAIVARARKTRYGQRFGEDLSAWPVLSKEMVRDRPSDFVVPGPLRVPAATGGTTGMPLRLSRSIPSFAAEQVFLDDLLVPHGLNWRRARVATIRPEFFVKELDDRTPPFGRITHGGRRLILSSSHLAADSLDAYLDQIAAFKPDILNTVPNMIANILMLLARSGRKLRVPLLVSSSARLDASLYAAAEREIAGTVIDYYGLAERCAFAVRRSADRWFFEPVYGRIELVATPADEVSRGRRHVQVVATGYWNEAQPLIRYDTGDRALVEAGASDEDLEAIAIGERPFFGIAGRDSEFIWAPDGGRITGLSVLTYEVPNVLQLQLVQDAWDHLLVRARTLPSFGPADRARIIANARAKIPRAIHIDIEVVDQLEVTTRGKVPFTIRHIDEEVLLSGGAP
jgi:phenylacetate-CoA ligase